MHLLARVSLNLNLVETITEAVDLVCREIKAIIGQGYVAITLLDQASQTLRIEALLGIEDENLINALLRVAGPDPRKMQVPVKDFTFGDLSIYTSGHLEIMKDGLYSILMRKYPKTVCNAIAYLLGVRFVYTMGFVYRGHHIGGVGILTDSSTTIEATAWSSKISWLRPRQLSVDFALRKHCVRANKYSTNSCFTVQFMSTSKMKN